MQIPSVRTPLSNKTNEEVSTPSHYDALSVTKEAGNKTIRKAYYRKARHLHPDKGGNAKDFRKASNAYEILSSPSKREIYDLEQLIKTLSFDRNKASSVPEAQADDPSQKQRTHHPTTNWDRFLHETNKVFKSENAYDFLWIRAPPSFDPFRLQVMTAEQVNGLRIIVMTVERLQAQQWMANNIEAWSEMQVIGTATNSPSTTFYDGPYKDFRSKYSKGNYANKLNWILAISYTLYRSLQPTSLPIFSLWLEDPTAQKVLSGLGRSWVSLRKKNAAKELRVDNMFSYTGIGVLLEDLELAIEKFKLSFKWRE